VSFEKDLEAEIVKWETYGAGTEPCRYFANWARQYLTKPTVEIEKAAEEYKATGLDKGSYRKHSTDIYQAIKQGFLAGASHIQAQMDAVIEQLNASINEHVVRRQEANGKIHELEVELEQLKGKVFDEKFMRNIALGRNDIHREDILNLESENAALKVENDELKRKGQE